MKDEKFKRISRNMKKDIKKKVSKVLNIPKNKIKVKYE